MFRDGLKGEIKDLIINYGGRINTLNSFINTAIELDDKLYEKRIKDKRRGKPFKRTGNYSKGPHYPNRKRG